MSSLNLSSLSLSKIFSPLQNTTNDTTPESKDTQDDIQLTKYAPKNKVNKQVPAKTSYSPQKVNKALTITRLSDNTMVYQGNSLTLEAINHYSINR